MTERTWYERLGRTLRETRLSRGWTIYDVAAVAEVSGATVSRWEHGSGRMKAYQYVSLKGVGLLP